MSLLLLFRPSTTSIVPGPAIPGQILAYREPASIVYMEAASAAYREPIVRTGQ